MSLCRWSSDDFQCDLYIYVSGDDDYTIMVAANRYDFGEPLPEPVDGGDLSEAWFARYEAVKEMVRKAPTIPIDLPHAGESFWHLTAEEAADRVRDLRVLGYRCPDHVESELREEARENR